MRVAVIGSGLGGLSAACTLAARGYQVDVFEKNPWLGGKAAVLQEQGFRFDKRLEAALAATQDELAPLAKLRNPERFETILSGRVGISGVYEAWKRCVALLTGRVYQGSHGSIRHL